MVSVLLEYTLIYRIGSAHLRQVFRVASAFHVGVQVRILSKKDNRKEASRSPFFKKNLEKFRAPDIEF
jgi:transposase